MSGIVPGQGSALQTFISRGERTAAGPSYVMGRRTGSSHSPRIHME